MQDQQNIITQVWLCDEVRFTQSEGQEGTLEFNGAAFVYIALDGSKIEIPLQELQLADLKNIMAQSILVLTTTQNKSYVFSFAVPVSNKEAATLAYLTPRAVAGIITIKRLKAGTTNASRWRKALVNSLPKEKIAYRKEVRPLAVIATSLAFIVVLLGIMYGALILLTK